MEELIIKYLNGKANSDEKQMLLDWINESDENLKSFSSFQSFWICQTMPHTRATSEEEKRLFKTIISSSVQKKPVSKDYLKYAAAFIIILLGLNLVFIQRNNRSGSDLFNQQIASNNINGYSHEVYTEKGVKGKVVLPDSSIVWLNSDSKIIFPDKFEGKNREVTIASGEFLFDVVPNPEKPMIVRTNRNFEVEVLGTTFNIRNYEQDSEAQTTLLSGSIKLTKKSNKSDKSEVIELIPNDSYIFKDNNSSTVIHNEEVTNKQVAWKDGILIFESTPMEQVMAKLERWHGTKFYVEDPAVLDIKITATFHSESIIQVMEMIKFCSLVDYTNVDNKIYLKRKNVSASNN